MKALLAVLLLTLTSASSVDAAGGGLRGIVIRSPTRPVCVVGMPCSAPAKGVLVSFRKRSYLRSTHTGNDGRYRIALPAGVYAVTIAPARFGYLPRTAVVPNGRVAVRNFTIDTGIR